MIEKFFKISPHIRYAAIYQHGELTTQSRDDLTHASTAESDKYEELLVNPALLTLTQQRGNIDCGGCRHVLVRYGHFYQLILPIEGGHISVCIEAVPEIFKIINAIIEKSVH